MIDIRIALNKTWILILKSFNILLFNYNQIQAPSLILTHILDIHKCFLDKLNHIITSIRDIDTIFHSERSFS